MAAGSFKMEVKAPPALQTIWARIGNAGRSEIMASAAYYGFRQFRDHLRNYANSHHKSAAKLGATPTNILEQAAQTAVPYSNASMAEARATSPALSRALGPLTIKPKIKKWLTIPIDAMSYGKRWAEVATFSGRETFVVYPKKKSGKAPYIATDEGEGRIRPLYLLRKSVSIKHEPRMLPTEAAMQRAFRAGIKAELDYVMKGMKS